MKPQYGHPDFRVRYSDSFVQSVYDAQQDRYWASAAGQERKAQIRAEEEALTRQQKQRPAQCPRCGSHGIIGEYVYAPSGQVPQLSYWECLDCQQVLQPQETSHAAV